jgi:hypothetical protein
MSVTDCKALTDTTAGGLATQIATALGDGWQPYYASYFDGERHVQMMIKGLPVSLNAAGTGADAFVGNGDTVAVHNSAGGDSHDATAEVSSNTLTDVKFAATVAMVDDTDTVVVHNSAGSAVAGTHTAEVALGVLTDVKLASTIAPVANSATVVVKNSAGTTVTGTHTAVVAAGVLTDVALASTVAPIVNGGTSSVTPSGTFATTVTFTVAAGVITAIALS